MSALAQHHAMRGLQLRFDNLQPVPTPRNARDEIIDLTMSAGIGEKVVPYYSASFGIENHLMPLDVVLDMLDEPAVKAEFILLLSNHPEAVERLKSAAAHAFAEKHAAPLQKARDEAAFEARFA